MEVSILDSGEISNKFGPLVGVQELPLPKLDIEKIRWATIRHDKVEELHNRFSSNPNLAFIFEDPKFKGESLVMLRKGNFENMLNVLEDLKNGQAGIQFSAEELGIQLSLLKNLVSDKLGKEADNSIQEVLKLISISFSKISSKLFVFSKGKKNEPTPLTGEELEMLGTEEDD